MLRLKQGTRVVCWADLHAADRAAVQRITGQESVPALLMPDCGRGTVKAIDANVVTLLSRLQQSSALPNYSSVDELPTSLKALVLDDVVELRTLQGYVSGPEAASLLKSPGRAPNAKDPISRLSHDAILYGATLPLTDARALSSRLYRYNTWPCSARLQTTFGSNAQIAAMLGVTGSSPQVRCLIDAGYDRVDHVHWHAWTRRRYLDAEHMSGLRYKLYVSPSPEAIVDVVQRTVKVAIDLAVPSFKIGRSVANILRPDKLILYTDSVEALDGISRELTCELSGYPAQGVPFTRSLEPTGILSAGADPPRSLCLSGWAQAESWRAWMADRLALSLLQARASSSDPSKHCEFALTKLSIEGVDTGTWNAAKQLWQGEPS